MAARGALGPRAEFDTAQASRIAGVPATRLRQCVRAGLVSPTRDRRGRYRFDFVDLSCCARCSGSSDACPSPDRRVLDSLRRQIGSRPLARLAVYADGERVVAWDGESHWQPESGQFLFNFEANRVVQRARRIAQLPSPPKRAELPRLSAEEWCDLAIELEDGSPLERCRISHALD